MSWLGLAAEIWMLTTLKPYQEILLTTLLQDKI
jgi:hypothetical protein